MTKLMSLDSLKVGDKVLQVEYNQGLNGAVERAYANLITVVKCTKAKVYFEDDVYNIRFAMRKDGYNANSEFYYGIKTDYYLPEATQISSDEAMFHQQIKGMI